jgi:PHP family Zn ribbon phosphoesterase
VLPSDPETDMAIRTGDFDGAMTERCETCGRETRHDVSIRLHTESDRTENAEYSREPYRVSACRVCGTERTLRMNDA